MTNREGVHHYFQAKKSKFLVKNLFSDCAEIFIFQLNVGVTVLPKSSDVEH